MHQLMDPVCKELPWLLSEPLQCCGLIFDLSDFLWNSRGNRPRLCWRRSSIIQLLDKAGHMGTGIAVQCDCNPCEHVRMLLFDSCMKVSEAHIVAGWQPLAPRN